MNQVIEKIKASGLESVYFGPSGFYLVPEPELDQIQLGYSVGTEGEDLTGPEEGDRKKSWVVIGTDTELGDPFFVDVSEPNMPVYTAMHGVGDWYENQVATSLDSFLAALSVLKSKCSENSSLIVPNENSITSISELAQLELELSKISGTDDFWPEFFEQYKDWLVE
ncbi:hypothetical protein [Corallincola spongiicola]|uniref:SUKH-4 immunity protein n=1 Tax=Corallincola spongiicola TaxID=2520508 RepID=A0ABY1WS77_9GAMM|nr:hypothetical protein [Corallincola spongiicola]TAA47602.1 hypothetical protein EXY25_10335 [Corallincola spongiicola]